METIILSILLLISGGIIFFQNKKIQSLKQGDKNDNSISKNPNRKGVIREIWTRTTTHHQTQKVTTSDHKVVIEVEELEKLSGGLSRIKILNISGGADERQRRDIMDQTAKIIETTRIQFIDVIPPEIEITEKPFNV